MADEQVPLLVLGDGAHHPSGKALCWSQLPHRLPFGTEQSRDKPQPQVALGILAKGPAAPGRGLYLQRGKALAVEETSALGVGKLRGQGGKPQPQAALSVFYQGGDLLVGKPLVPVEDLHTFGIIAADAAAIGGKPENPFLVLPYRIDRLVSQSVPKGEGLESVHVAPERPSTRTQPNPALPVALDLAHIALAQIQRRQGLELLPVAAPHLIPPSNPDIALPILAQRTGQSRSWKALGLPDLAETPAVVAQDLARSVETVVAKPQFPSPVLGNAPADPIEQFALGAVSGRQVEEPSFAPVADDPAASGPDPALAVLVEKGDRFARGAFDAVEVAPVVPAQPIAKPSRKPEPALAVLQDGHDVVARHTLGGGEAAEGSAVKTQGAVESGPELEAAVLVFGDVFELEVEQIQALRSPVAAPQAVAAEEGGGPVHYTYARCLLRRDIRDLQEHKIGTDRTSPQPVAHLNRGLALLNVCG